MSEEGTADDRKKKRRLDREIKRLVREKAHLRRQITVDSLRKDASALYLAGITAIIKKIHDATDDASRLGDKFKPENSRSSLRKSRPKTL